MTARIEVSADGWSVRVKPLRQVRVIAFRMSRARPPSADSGELSPGLRNLLDRWSLT